MRTFTIYNDHTGDSHQIQADFMTVPAIGSEKFFWVKTCWWKPARRIGVVDGHQFRVITSTAGENDAQIAKQLGVKL